MNLLQVVIHFLPWFPNIFCYFYHRKPVLWKHTNKSSFSVFPGCNAFYRAAQHADQCSCVTDKFQPQPFLLRCAVHSDTLHFVLFLWFSLVKIGWLWLSCSHNPLYSWPTAQPSVFEAWSRVRTFVRKGLDRGLVSLRAHLLAQLCPDPSSLGAGHPISFKKHFFQVRGGVPLK